MTYMAREPYANFWPKVADTAFVAESADLIGDVTIGEHASVWYHTTLRADINKIVIGDYSNIQDNSCIHLADDFGCYVGKYVTVRSSARGLWWERARSLPKVPSFLPIPWCWVLLPRW